MYYHVCLYELCPNCGAMNCDCEMKWEGADGESYQCCPVCGQILRTCVTTFASGEIDNNKF